MSVRRTAGIAAVIAAVIGAAAAGATSADAARRRPPPASTALITVALTYDEPSPCAFAITGVKVTATKGVTVTMERVYYASTSVELAHRAVPYSLAAGATDTWNPGVTVQGGQYLPYVEVVAGDGVNVQTVRQPVRSASGYC